MTHSETVLAWNNTFFNSSPEEYGSYLSDDFQFIGPAPEPLGRDAYVGMMYTLKAACPNLSNSLKVISESGDVVQGSVQMAGKHTRGFDLTPMGIGVIAPTNRSFKLPEEQFTLTFKNGKIASFEVEVPEGGGLMGILGQIGALPG